MNVELLRHPLLLMLGQPPNTHVLKECFENSAFYIDNCDLGLGVFAKRDILKNDLIFVFGGSIIDFAETKRRGEWECMPIQIANNQYIDTLPPGVFFNHSCNPNAGIREDRNLIAIRNIRKGMEIRFDYSTTMEEHSFTMDCLCKSVNCRNVVSDFSTLPDSSRKRYLEQKIVMSFIARDCAAQDDPCFSTDAGDYEQTRLR